LADDFFKVSKGLSLKGRATEPANPTNGDVYYDTTLMQLRAYVDGAWVDLGASGGAGGYAKTFINM
jgi:hypothetical protein